MKLKSWNENIIRYAAKYSHAKYAHVSDFGLHARNTISLIKVFTTTLWPENHECDIMARGKKDSVSHILKFHYCS